jgi:hypothetical protein
MLDPFGVSSKRSTNKVGFVGTGLFTVGQHQCVFALLFPSFVDKTSMILKVKRINVDNGGSHYYMVATGGDGRNDDGGDCFNDGVGNDITIDKGIIW